MFKNKKWMKRMAMVTVIVMSVLMLASCQVGRTYVDQAGDASGIYVTEKDQQPSVPYTGEAKITYTEVDDPDKADIIVPHGERPDGSESSGSKDDDDKDNADEDENTGDENTGDENTGDENTGDENTGDENTGDENTGDENTGDENTGDEGDEDASGDYDAANLLKVISYNVRVADDGGEKDIEKRAPRLVEVITKRDPDIIGFQEVGTKWWETHNMKDMFPDYDYVMKYRAESSKEGTPIFWKKDKFELVKDGYFWLSETPDQESKGWGEEHYRIALWVQLKLKSTGKEFLYINTHYGFGPKAHVGSANLILQRMSALGGFTKYPVFFTADCNMSRYNDGYNAMMEGGKFSDINWDLEDLNYKTGGGYHDDGHEGLVTGSPIDFCFYSPALITPLKYEIIDEFLMNGWVSDHKGLYMEMALK